MSDKIIDLNSVKMKNGDLMFFGCKCGSEDGFAVVVAQGKGSPVATNLICLDCQHDYPILMGEIQG